MRIDAPPPLPPSTNHPCYHQKYSEVTCIIRADRGVIFISMLIHLQPSTLDLGERSLTVADRSR